MKLLITCSGLSNTGRLTTQVAAVLMRTQPGVFEWIQARKPPEEIQACTEDAEEIVVLDGCEDYCAMKRLGVAGVAGPCCCHLVATECGVVKNGLADVRYEEIELVVREVARVLRDLPQE